MRLTDRTVASLKAPATGQLRVRDDLLPGFGVIVGKRTKTFYVMFGRERHIKTLGKYPSKSLQDARNEARRVLEQGLPQKRATSLVALVDAFLEDCRTRLKDKTVASYETILKNAPELPIEKVDKTTVNVSTAHEIKAYKTLFNWALREELVTRNPFLHLTARFGKRDRVLTNSELKAIWDYEDPPYTDIVKLLILTGQRVGQFADFKAEWVKGGQIYFPASVMKNGTPHQIPVIPMMKPYLRDLSWRGWSKSKQRMDRETGVTGYTLHDLRRTYATIHVRMPKPTPIHVIEALLHHTSGTISGVTAIYIRHKYEKEMREAALQFQKYFKMIIDA